MTHQKNLDVAQSQEWKATWRYALISLQRDSVWWWRLPEILVTKWRHLGSGEQSSVSIDEQTSN